MMYGPIEVFIVQVAEQGSDDYVILGTRVTEALSVFFDLSDAETCAMDAEEEDNLKTIITRGTLYMSMQSVL